MTFDTPPPLTDTDLPYELKITAQQLGELLDDDSGAAMIDSIFSRILSVRHDEAEWQRILTELRRHRALMTFQKRLSRHDKESHKKGISAGWQADFIRRENKNGEMVIENIHSNYVLALTHDPDFEGVLAIEDFSNQIVTRKPPPFKRFGVQWCDADALNVKSWLERKWGFRPTTNAVHEAIIAVSSNNKFNALHDYLDGLEDDCDSNLLDNWLVRCFGCADNEYTRTVGRKWLISAVARAFEPGCKVDTILILEGDQGLRKSNALRRLCPNPRWFVDGLSEFGSKAQAEEIDGKWIIELAEMKGFSGREQDQIKAFVSREAENYRPAYARNTVHSPRKCVFAATINPENVGYLKDPTGNRRYWPVKCMSRSESISDEFRDQLWAEAVKAYRAGEKWWIEDEKIIQLVEAEQAERMQVDPWHDAVGAHLETTSDTSVDEIFTALHIEKAKWTYADARRICSVLTSLNWKKYRATKEAGGRRPWRYKSPTANGEYKEPDKPSNNVRAMFPGF